MPTINFNPDPIHNGHEGLLAVSSDATFPLVVRFSFLPHAIGHLDVTVENPRAQTVLVPKGVIGCVIEDKSMQCKRRVVVVL